MRSRILCPNCGSDVEHLAYCGVCGQPLPDTPPAGEGRFASRLGWLRRLREIPAYRIVWLVCSALILIALLANQAGLAIALGAILVPILTVSYLTGIDIYEREPWMVIAGVIAAGVVVGLLAGWLSTLAFDQLWFDTSPFNLGAGGFAGDAANGQGSAPISVILINGVLVPILSAVATLAGPVSFRRSAAFRNEVTDGLTLGAAAGGGFALAMAIVYFWPVFFDSSMPSGTVSEWTASLVGLVILRPLIAAFAGGLLGVAIWGYAQTQRSRDLAWPLAAGIIGWVGLPIGQLLLMPYAATWELLWAAVVLIAVFVLFRLAVAHSLAVDRRVLVGGAGAERVVCPNCQRVTPDGTYCAFCGAELHPEATPSLTEPGAAPAPEAWETDEGAEPAPLEPRVSDAEDLGERVPAAPPDEGAESDAALVDGADRVYSSEAVTPDRASNSDAGSRIGGSPHEPVPSPPPPAWYDLGQEDQTEPSLTNEREGQGAALGSSAGDTEAWLPSEGYSRDEALEHTPDAEATEESNKAGSAKGLPARDDAGRREEQ